MYYKSNPNNYTRCEKCKYIDREKEECKITNDKWLVPDNAGICHQFKEVERMEVVCIENKGVEETLKKGKVYKIFSEKKYGKSVFYELENARGDFKKNRFKEIVGEADCLWYRRDAEGNRILTPDKKYKITAFVENNIEIIDDAGRVSQYSKDWFVNIRKYEEDYKLKLDKQMEKVSEMLKDCSINSEKVNESFEGVNLAANIVRPNYYKAGKFDVIGFCFEHDLDFATGNIIKYVTRAGKKDENKTLEDLEKAMEYLRRKIERAKEGN